MRFSHFFIDRPIFATVLSVILTIVGVIAGASLPIAEYPEIAPPTVNITANYPGASAAVIAETVAAPIEQEVNGVDNMLYIVSQSTGDGRLSISVVFKPGTDIDQAQVLVQNRVSIAEPRLPEDVRRLGLTVLKASPDLMMVVHMISPDGSRDQQYISNYATLYIRDRLARIDGIGDSRVFGARDYSMRVWLDPEKVASRNLTAGEVVAALRAANLQVAAGSINQPPASSPGAFTLSVHTLGRLTTPEEFENIVIRAEDERRSGAREGCRARRARLAGLHRQRLPFEQGGDGGGAVPAARIERACDSSGRQGGDGAARQGFPAGCRLHHRVQPDRLHPVFDRRRDRHVHRGADPRRARRHPVPADVARGRHSDHRHSGVADRRVHRHGCARDLVQHAVAVRAGARDRHRRRRRDRRGRERGAQADRGADAQRRRRTRPWTKWAAR